MAIGKTEMFCSEDDDKIPCVVYSPRSSLHLTGDRIWLSWNQELQWK